MTNEEALKETIINMATEVEMWRREFLEAKFSKVFAVVTPQWKTYLTEMVKCTPASQFASSTELWDKAVICLITRLVKDD